MKRNLTQKRILAERMKRQGISEPVSTEDAYARLFRTLQPVSPIAYSRPGSPPCLEHRAGFNTFLSHGAHRDAQRKTRTSEKTPYSHLYARCKI